MGWASCIGIACSIRNVDMYLLLAQMLYVSEH